VVALATPPADPDFDLEMSSPDLGTTFETDQIDAFLGTAFAPNDLNSSPADLAVESKCELYKMIKQC